MNDALKGIDAAAATVVVILVMMKNVVEKLTAAIVAKNQQELSELCQTVAAKQQTVVQNFKSSCNMLSRCYSSIEQQEL